EGPAVDANGILYAVNFEKSGTIGMVKPDGEAGIFVELPEGSVGNGIRFNSKGEMLIADYPQHNILKVDMATREISVYAHEAKMNQPNDIAIDDSDRLYASDPNWKESTGNIWRIDPDGTVTLLEENMGTTNGIEVSPNYHQHYIHKVYMATREISVYAHEAKMKQPNDIAIDDSDRLYASDPNWKESTGNIWRIDPDGTVTLLEENMGTTNGIEVSPNND